MRVKRRKRGLARMGGGREKPIKTSEERQESCIGYRSITFNINMPAKGSAVPDNIPLRAST